MKKISPLWIGLLPLVLACKEEPPAPACGDGAVDAGEECDDGNVSNGDECRADCTLPVCGDGAQDAGEECDDGDNIDGDGCESDCTLPFCGNNITDSDEECDDGNNVSGDGCTSTCDDEVCGDGIVNNSGAEQCDDGNQDNLDECRNNCQLPACGDGIEDAGEECDDGDLESGDGCDENCTTTACGNGIVTNEICFTPSSFDAGTDINFIALGDIDGDQDLDLAAVNSGDNVTVLKNNGSGQFLAPLVLTPGAGLFSVLFVDIDQDQDQDLLALVPDQQFFTSFRLLENDGTGLFDAPVEIAFLGFAGSPFFDDVDNDDDLDMIVPGLGATSIMLNDGAGTFALGSTLNDGAVMEMLDFDGDGDNDLLLNQLVGDGDTNLARNNAGQYTIEPLFNRFLFDLVPIDLGSDGDFDIVTLNSSTPEASIVENEAGTFAAPVAFATPPLSSGVTIDFNTDGFLDVITVNTSQSRFLSLMLNDGVGTLFSPLDFFPLAGTGSALVVGDINGDGLPDLLANNQTTGDILIFSSNH